MAYNQLRQSVLLEKTFDEAMNSLTNIQAHTKTKRQVNPKSLNQFNLVAAMIIGGCLGWGCAISAAWSLNPLMFAAAGGVLAGGLYLVQYLTKRDFMSILIKFTNWVESLHWLQSDQALHSNKQVHLRHHLPLIGVVVANTLVGLVSLELLYVLSWVNFDAISVVLNQVGLGFIVGQGLISLVVSMLALSLLFGLTTYIGIGLFPIVCKSLRAIVSPIIYLKHRLAHWKLKKIKRNADEYDQNIDREKYQIALAKMSMCHLVGFLAMVGLFIAPVLMHEMTIGLWLVISISFIASLMIVFYAMDCHLSVKPTSYASSVNLSPGYYLGEHPSLCGDNNCDANNTFSVPEL